MTTYKVQTRGLMGLFNEAGRFLGLKGQSDDARLITLGGVKKRHAAASNRAFWARNGRVAATTNIAAGATGATFHFVVRLPVRPIRWRFLLANGGATDYVVTEMGSRAIASMADYNNNASSWVGVSKSYRGGAGGWPVPALAAPVAGQANFVETDWQGRGTIPSTDPAGGYLLAARVSVAQVASMTIVGNGAEGSLDLSNWADRTDADNYCYRALAGQHVTSAGTFGTGVNRSYSPIYAVEYMTDQGELHTIATGGDSTYEGAIGLGAGYFGESWAKVVADQLNTAKSGKRYTAATMAWSGDSSLNYAANLSRLLPIVGKSIKLLIVPGGSPNDAAGAIDQNVVDAWRISLGTILAVASEQGVPVAVGTIMPSNPAIKAYGASDALRRQYNAEMVAANGDNVIDFARIMGGGFDPVTGQELMNPEFNNDGIHPDNPELGYFPATSGHDAMAELAAPLVELLIAA